MRVSRLSSCLLVLGLAGNPVWAAEHEPGSSVEMPYLIAPLVVDGQLLANAYVSSRIVATSPAATFIVRDKLAFIQDAFVRDVNASPIGKSSDPSTVDVSGLAARLLEDTKRIVGSSYIDSIQIVRIQMSPLRANGHS